MPSRNDSIEVGNYIFQRGMLHLKVWVEYCKDLERIPWSWEVLMKQYVRGGTDGLELLHMAVA